MINFKSVFRCQKFVKSRLYLSKCKRGSKFQHSELSEKTADVVRESAKTNSKSEKERPSHPSQSRFIPLLFRCILVGISREDWARARRKKVKGGRAFRKFQKKDGNMRQQDGGRGKGKLEKNEGEAKWREAKDVAYTLLEYTRRGSCWGEGGWNVNFIPDSATSNPRAGRFDYFCSASTRRFRATSLLFYTLPSLAPRLRCGRSGRRF